MRLNSAELDVAQTIAEQLTKPVSASKLAAAKHKRLMERGWGK